MGQQSYAGGRAVAQVTRDDSSSNPTVRALHDDLLGSIHTISEDGALQAGRDYAPFGQQRASGGLDSQVPYGFTGHESDTDLGLVNMKGRMYDPHIGQFLSADPIVARPYSQGLNRFAYVNNSPLNFVDPSGFTGKPLEEDQAWALPATIGGGMFVAGGGLQATGGAISSAASSTASVLSTVGGGVASTLGPAIGNIWIAMNLPGSTTSTSTVKLTGSRGGTGVGVPARYRAAQADYAPVQESAPATFGQNHATAVCGAGGPTCRTRPFGSSPIDSLVVEFLNRPSPEVALQGMTVAESILAPSAPEHAAAIIRDPSATAG